jgi:bestrophin-3
MRRTMVRYLHLSYWLVLIKASSAVKKRFPTMQHIIASGMMTEKELEAYDRVK